MRACTQACTTRAVLKTLERKLMRSELARLYHWEGRDRLVPLRLDGEG